jgi:hypothetical protein
VRHRRIIRNDIDVFGGMTIDRTRAYCPADALLPGVVHLSPLCNLSPPDLRGGLFFAIRGHCTDTAAFLALHSRQRNQRSRSTNPTWWWAASAALFRE